MKTIIELKQANEYLKKYEGANVKIECYTHSLKRIMLKLSFNDQPEVIYLTGVSCDRFHGHFEFTNAYLEIQLIESEQKLTRIIDKNSDFELITSGGYSIAVGSEEEFGIPFEDFFRT